VFEVIVTLRPDFKEALLHRYPTWEEAEDRARALALKYPDRVVRAKVRRVTFALAPDSRPVLPESEPGAGVGRRGVPKPHTAD